MTEEAYFLLSNFVLHVLSFDYDSFLPEQVVENKCYIPCLPDNIQYRKHLNTRKSCFKDYTKP
jgi:hypothetical protein